MLWIEMFLAHSATELRLQTSSQTQVREGVRVFWIKNKVGEDLNQEGVSGSEDSFFDKSIYSYYGYAIGFQMGANMTITVKNITSHYREAASPLTSNRKLVRNTNLVLETALSF